MSVRVEGELIHLEGRCLAEDAEPLLAALQARSGAIVDVRGAQRLHLAVVQILLAARSPVRGLADHPSLGQLLIHLLP